MKHDNELYSVAQQRQVAVDKEQERDPGKGASPKDTGFIGKCSEELKIQNCLGKIPSSTNNYSIQANLRTDKYQHVPAGGAHAWGCQSRYEEPVSRKFMKARL